MCVLLMRVRALVEPEISVYDCWQKKVGESAWHHCYLEKGPMRLTSTWRLRPFSSGGSVGDLTFALARTFCCSRKANRLALAAATAGVSEMWL
ncbi:hypothetical protein BaRGS_00004786 [Batillaria attramentaria]|uniref:Uncharacterized protein n=1 Tax=Batillaria attramentaria TaxID=370345 RepID=A0ABD0LYD3_9CAEN